MIFKEQSTAALSRYSTMWEPSCKQCLLSIEGPKLGKRGAEGKLIKFRRILSEKQQQQQQQLQMKKHLEATGEKTIDVTL